MKKKYDVFISYRRKNADGNDEGTHIARTIKLSLDLLMQNTDSCCFFDYSNMSNEDFPTRILNTIASAKVFVCVLTKNAMQRCENEEDWVRREILQAKQCGLKIIFINPDGQFTGDYPSKFPKELDFVRTTNHLTVHTDSSFDRDIQAIYNEEIYPAIMRISQPSPRPPRKPFNFETLRKALFATSGVGLLVEGVVETISYMKEQKRIAEEERIAEERRKAEEKRIADEKRFEALRNRVYKIGDYYDDGKKQGVVFEVTADGQHGKIVSLTESCVVWSSDVNEYSRLIGADDKYNGAKNMAKVMQIKGWRNKYPVFSWCADLGEGWYLPAIEELKKFTLDDTIHDAVNRTLETKGTKLANKGEWHWYWSSTEDDEFSVWRVSMHDGDTYYLTKSSDYSVRAVSAF